MFNDLQVEERSRRKQISVDSGNDGDVSCFEASDASNIGIACIAAEKKEKVNIPFHLNLEYFWLFLCCHLFWW